MYKVLIKKFSIFQKKPIFFFAECIKEYSIKISSKSDENWVVYCILIQYTFKNTVLRKTV